MKVLWITNFLFPEAEEVLNGSLKGNPFGGWMTSAAKQLAMQPDVDLAIASVSRLVDDLRSVSCGKLLYFVIPMGKGNESINYDYNHYWTIIYEDFKPDVIHIHGSEYSHGLSFVEACGFEHVIVSIQGMISDCHSYYLAGIPSFEYLINTTARDLVKGTVFCEKRRIKKRSRYEVELLRSVKHIIGRTTWDRVHSLAINPDATYHFCNETLRSSFYSSHWSYRNCIPHTIFLAQASYPLKGAHQVLKALPAVLEKYPDAKVHIAGVDITRPGGFFNRLKLSSYGRIIRKLIRKSRLGDSVFFHGPLNESEMVRQYLSSNVFISPSSIENSPNSLCEAQLLGVPCIASFVGGIPDLIPDSESGYLYRFEDVDVLSYYICKVFEESQSRTYDVMRSIAMERHDPGKNVQSLLGIYNRVIAED